MNAMTKNHKSLSRRNFLKTAAGTAGFAMTAPMFVPSSVFGANAPSNRITLAAIGVGGKGTGNMTGFMNLEGTQILAVCDVERGSNNYGGYYKGKDYGRLPAKKRVEAYYAEKSPAGSYKGCDDYENFQEVLARNDIDAVINSTPDHWHAPISIAAMKAGKDVYCEKPLTLTIAEGRLLADAAKQYNRIVQTGSQQRSGAGFQKACELVRSGRIGKITSVEVGISNNNVKNPIDWKEEPVPEGFNYNLWLGPAPQAPYTTMRCHYTFRFLMEYSGGQMTNWGAHFLDIAQWGLGMDDSGPVEIVGKGEFFTEGLFSTPQNVDIEYTYANGVKLFLKSTGGHTKFIGTDGWINVNRSKLLTSSPDICPSQDSTEEQLNPDSEGKHYQNFIDCVRSRTPCICTAEIGHRSATVCHLGNIAMMMGRKLIWDPAKETFPNDWAANSFLARKMRNPWNY